ncbi:MAG: hypothetical protein QOI07_3203 [Verrucomicrobiota bacterium]
MSFPETAFADVWVLDLDRLNAADIARCDMCSHQRKGIARDGSISDRTAMRTALPMRWRGSPFRRATRAWRREHGFSRKPRMAGQRFPQLPAFQGCASTFRIVGAWWPASSQPSPTAEWTLNQRIRATTTTTSPARFWLLRSWRELPRRLTRNGQSSSAATGRLKRPMRRRSASVCRWLSRESRSSSRKELRAFRTIRRNGISNIGRQSPHIPSR